MDIHYLGSKYILAYIYLDIYSTYVYVYDLDNNITIPLLFSVLVLFAKM